MNRSKLMRRLSVVAALAIVLAVVAGAPTLQAQPEAGTISTGAGVQVWNGHSCPANVPVNIAGLSAGLGGYETKIAWPAGRFDNTAANVGVALTSYLAVNGRTNSSGALASPLKAVVGDTVKFADFSYGTNNPPGNTTDDQLATVSLIPLTCGNASLTMSATETQLVNINGDLIDLTAAMGSTVNVRHLYDTDGDGLPFITSGDVLVVVSEIGPWDGGCNTGYQYDTDLDGLPFITSGDVLAVVAAIGPVTCP